VKLEKRARSAGLPKFSLHRGTPDSVCPCAEKTHPGSRAQGGFFDGREPAIRFISNKREVRKMMDIMKNLVRDEEGQGLTEYALIIAFIAVVIIATLIAFRGNIVSVFNNAGTQLSNPN
jgi:pilus assembly protein Flp/PilA